MPNTKGRGRRFGRMGGGSGSGRGSGMGAEGKCVCLKCGYSTPKKPAVKCLDERCPTCGTALVRKGGAHYINGIQKKNKEV